MQIRLFLHEKKQFKSNATLKDLVDFDKRQDFAYFLAEDERDLLTILELCTSLTQKNTLYDLRQKLVIDDNYIVHTVMLIGFEKKNIIKTHIKILVTTGFVLIFDAHKHQFIKLAFEKTFKENHLIQKSPIIFYSAFLGKIIDHYNTMGDLWADDIATAEVAILEHKSMDMSQNLATIRKKIVYLRTTIQNLIDQLNIIHTHENALIHEEANTFAKTLHKANFTASSVHHLTNMTSNLYSLYLTNLSARQNEINKTLAIIATIFLPASFITGFFGMNFDMPFLKSQYSYIMCSALALLSIIIALVYFRKKKWL